MWRNRQVTGRRDAGNTSGRQAKSVKGPRRCRATQALFLVDREAARPLLSRDVCLASSGIDTGDGDGIDTFPLNPFGLQLRARQLRPYIPIPSPGDSFILPAFQPPPFPFPSSSLFPTFFMLRSSPPSHPSYGVHNLNCP